MKLFLNLFTIIFVCIGLIACGGSSGGGAATATGIFKDTNVQGLGYSSGGQKGMTSSDGRFTYEVGKDVTFSVGGVNIGSSKGQAVITPVDLIVNGNTDSVEVQNIVRFLLWLDSNGSTDDGITIPEAVSTIADTWAQVNFSAADFETELTEISDDLSEIYQFVRVFPTAVEAKNHLESTLLCARAGGYRGTFTGDDTGSFGLMVSALDGQVSGFAFDNDDMELIALTGTSPVQFNQTAAFISGNTDSGAVFEGQFDGVNRLSGEWSNSIFSSSGTFSGQRIGGNDQAFYRFTGQFTGAASGLFTFDIDADDMVAGLAYTVYAADGTSNELATFEGSVSGSSLTATIQDGGEVDATISGTVNKLTGTLTGTWIDADENSGSFTGNGCILNPVNLGMTSN